MVVDLNYHKLKNLFFYSLILIFLFFSNAFSQDYKFKKIIDLEKKIFPELYELQKI